MSKSVQDLSAANPTFASRRTRRFFESGAVLALLVLGFGGLLTWSYRRLRYDKHAKQARRTPLQAQHFAITLAPDWTKSDNESGPTTTFIHNQKTDSHGRITVLQQQTDNPEVHIQQKLTALRAISKDVTIQSDYERDFSAYMGHLVVASTGKKSERSYHIYACIFYGHLLYDIQMTISAAAWEQSYRDILTMCVSFRPKSKELA